MPNDGDTTSDTASAAAASIPEYVSVPDDHALTAQPPDRAITQPRARSPIALVFGSGSPGVSAAHWIRSTAIVAMVTSRQHGSSGGLERESAGNISSIRRAVTFGTLMWRFARHFGSNRATAADYELSVSSRQYDYFVSHSWRAPRRQKFFALLFHFNLIPAIVVANACAAAACMLTVQGALPRGTRRTEIVGTQLVVPYAPWCQAAGLASFLITLICWTWLRTGLEHRRLLRPLHFFLDKLCIHQTEPVLKQQGIDGIGGFLRSARTMLILWSPEYFTRLWCCFEVAVFITPEASRQRGHATPGAPSEPSESTSRRTPGGTRAHTPGRMLRRARTLDRIWPLSASSSAPNRVSDDHSLAIVPLRWSQATFKAAAILYACLSIYHLMAATVSGGAMADVMMALTVLSALTLSRAPCCASIADRLQLSQQVASFSLLRAECQDEADRAVVGRVVAQLYRPLPHGSASRSCSPSSASPTCRASAETVDSADVGIANFEAAVHSRIDAVVQQQLGPPTRLPRRSLLLLSTAYWLSQLDLIAAYIACSDDPTLCTPVDVLPVDEVASGAPLDWGRLCALRVAMYALLAYGVVPLLSVLQLEVAWLVPKRKDSRALERACALGTGLASTALWMVLFTGALTLADRTDRWLLRLAFFAALTLLLAAVATSFRLRRLIAQPLGWSLRREPDNITPVQTGATGATLPVADAARGGADDSPSRV